ncbi:hypothetical protein NC490_00750 [Streptomyces sp. G1]|nr:hypothetical protein [Streptomyces sp. G1]
MGVEPAGLGGEDALRGELLTADPQPAADPAPELDGVLAEDFAPRQLGDHGDCRADEAGDERVLLHAVSDDGGDGQREERPTGLCGPGGALGVEPVEPLEPEADQPSRVERRGGGVRDGLRGAERVVQVGTDTRRRPGDRHGGGADRAGGDAAEDDPVPVGRGNGDLDDVLLRDLPGDAVDGLGNEAGPDLRAVLHTGHGLVLGVHVVHA